jgi:hypothetical protein
MIIRTSPEQTCAILRAMFQVGTVRGTKQLTHLDFLTLEAAARHVFPPTDRLDLSRLSPISPLDLTVALSDSQFAQYAARFLTIMALVDGEIDTSKIAIVLEYAQALNVHEDYLQDLTETLRGHISWVAMDMMRHNVQSIAGMHWQPDNLMAEFLPYTGTEADHALAKRYQALGLLPEGTLGRAFWGHYQKNGYPFPGEQNGLSEKFAVPHDSTHVLSGYNTSPQGELLVSTFTAAMHK